MFWGCTPVDIVLCTSVHPILMTTMSQESLEEIFQIKNKQRLRLKDEVIRFW